jgi:hypothetical protein
MGGPDAPTPSGGTQTRTITGTTSLTQVGNSIVCTSDGHSFEAGEGTIAVTLVATSAPVAAQVCHPTAVNHDTECTIPPFAPIGVGETLTANLRGGRQQVLKFVPAACGQPGIPPPAPPITYTATLVYPG